MTEINRRVLDISHHNTVTSWEKMRAAGIVGVIHKSTEGLAYVDAKYLERRKQARQAGLLWGAYHFANNSNVSTQVDHFLKVAGVDDQTLYALDWETDPRGNTMTLGSAKEFLRLMGERIGMHRCVVYSGNIAKEALGLRNDEFFGAHRLWLAQYGLPYRQRSWDNYWLWQYSDGNVGPGPHGCPGVGGEVDTNHWDGTDQELRDQWSGSIVAEPVPPEPNLPEPKPEVATVDIVTTGDVTISVNGKTV